MKKIICFMLALLSVMSLAACGSYTEGSTATRDSFIQIGPGEVDPEAQDTSTVTLKLNGKPIAENPGFYELYLELDIYAQWTNGYTTVVALFDEEGVAVATGLDGDYGVTLLVKKKGEQVDSSSAFSQTIGDYTYNINGHTTTNDNRRIELELYRILYGDGPGTDLYYPYIKEFSDTGVYKITLESPDQVVLCRFAPGVSGIYTIESWVSAVDDNINPQYDYYYGSVAAAWYGYTINDGGAEGIYTKNFKDVRTVTDDEIGNVFIFGIHGTSKDGMYPIDVYISVLKTGEMEDRYPKFYMVPQEQLRRAPEHPDGVFTGYYQVQSNGRMLLDASKCRLWKKEAGGDGYYHIYDEVEYASNGGWGPTLYAQITSTTIMEYALNQVEWMGQGNNMLTLSDGTAYYSFKQFIEGFESLATKHGAPFAGTNYCVEDCKCHKSTDRIFACKDFCEGCHSTCTQVLPELYGTPGYANAVNSDGVYPVTEELQQFLQLFAECHNLFCDGTGDVEKEGMDADQDSMWLWCVGYYSDDNGGLCEMGAVIPNYFDK